MTKHLYLGYNSEAKREPNDYYATDPEAVERAIPVLREMGLSLHIPLWECACGEGHISEVLKKHDYMVQSSDLINRGYGEVKDFLTQQEPFEGDIITNPPFNKAEEFLDKALSLVKPGRRIFFLLKIQFLEGLKRRKIFNKCPPRFVAVYSKRIRCGKNANFEGGKTMCFAWFVWEKGFIGKPQILWS